MAVATDVRPPTRPAQVRTTAVDSRYRRGAGRWLVLAAAVLVGLAVLAPFGIMLLNAFKSPQDYAANGPLSWPSSLYLDGVVAFWERTEFPVKLWNSVFISAVVAVLGALLSLLNAYAIGIGRVKGRLWIVALFLLANMLPQEALIYPLFTMAQSVGLSNSQWSVIIIFTVIQSAFGTYLLSSVLGAFPREIIEAARIDGANSWQILWRMVVPVSRPTLGVLLVFFFIWTWNEFLLPLVMLPSNDNQTVSVALGVLQGQRLMDATMTNAAGLLGALPAIVFFLLFQRTLTRGIAVGAVK